MEGTAPIAGGGDPSLASLQLAAAQLRASGLSLLSTEGSEGAGAAPSFLGAEAGARAHSAEVRQQERQRQQQQVFCC